MMSDFNYDIEETTLYTFDSAVLYGESVQDGEPTPESPIPIYVVSAPNLFDIENTTWLEGKSINNSGNYVNANGIHTTNEYYKILPGEYTMSITKNSSVANGTIIAFYDSSKNFLSRKVAIASTSATGRINGTFTTVTNTAFFRISIQDTATDIQVELGTQANKYIPFGQIGMNYDENTAPIDMENNFLAALPDGTKDELTINKTGETALVKKIAYTNQAQTEGVTGTVGVDVLSSTGEIADDADVYYKLAEPEEIELDSLDVSSLFEILQVIPITFVTTLDPESAYSYTSKKRYEVLNPYEDYDAPEMAIPPVHPLMQEWETFDPNNWNKQNMLDYTYQNEWHAVYTVYLGELMQSGVFNWSRPELNWEEAAYDEEQYKRVCDYFNLRFKWREISMLPILKWFDYLRNKLVYELMPKYKPLYDRVAEGINPLAGENEYYKNRTIESAYPETLLSENADYITDGKDEEFQRIKEKGTADAMINFAEFYKGVDELLLDELEVMFISLYTTNINGL